MNHLARIDRRGFGASLAVAASCAATPYVHATDKTASDFHNTTIGQGDFRYRVDKRWCKANREQYPVRDCHEMVQSSDGRLFLVTNHRQNNILVFDIEGKVVDSWTLGSGSGHGLTCHREADGREHLFVTCNDGRVVKTTLEGEVVFELPRAVQCKAYQSSQAYVPTETAIADNGDIYVADGYGSQFILQFDKSGNFIRKFGGKSTRPIPVGRFLQAHGVAIDRRGEQPLLVCTERVRNEFNWFTLDGKHVRSVYLPGAYVSRPVIDGDYLYSGVCFGSYPHDHRMYVDRGFVTILDKNDRVVSNPGGQPARYEDGKLQIMLQENPVFQNCHDVCVDTNQNLYVCQWASNNVYPYKLHREA